jgi:type II secretory pathway pseudopilin PulG
MHISIAFVMSIAIINLVVVVIVSILLARASNWKQDEKQAAILRQATLSTSLALFPKR